MDFVLPVSQAEREKIDVTHAPDPHLGIDMF